MDRFHFIERAYRTSIAANRALLEAASEAEFATEICRIAVVEAGYTLAWVGYAESDPGKSVRACAQYGFDGGYICLAAVTWSDDARGSGPTGMAIRTGEPQVAQHIATDPRFEPWRADALRRGYCSSAAIPLRDGNTTFGALNLYAPEADAFDAGETELLRVVAEDLSHGILGLRGRRALSVIQRALDHADRLVAVGRAAATLAHDVNNHLAIALLSAEQVAGRTGEPDRTILRESIAAVGRAVALNRELLRMAGKSPIQPRLFVPDTALRELEPALRRSSGAAASLQLELTAGFAPVLMDPRAFEQIVTNLVINARDAMADHGLVRIKTSLAELRHPMTHRHVGLDPGSYVSLQVTDTGHGIPPELLESVFEPFFTTKGELGTGLGLASALGCASQAGGSISVRSEVGTGTTFEVLLPRAEETAGLAVRGDE